MASTPAADEAQVRALYRQFGAHEAAARSPVYEEISGLIGAGRSSALPMLLTLPPEKRRPNLLYAAVQYVTGALTGAEAFEAALAGHREEIVAVMLSHRTQTNLPGRCAQLLPVLARLPQPLALVEVGCSAGLCLYPDRYGYDYGAVRIPGSPEFACRVDGPETVAVPSSPIEVVWRAGLDLHPLDVDREEDRRWLDALVWPGEEVHREHLREAAAVARADPSHLIQGDLRTDLPFLLATAPSEATLVVFHTAVLAYVPSAPERAAFADTVRAFGAVWVANEPPSRIPGVVAPESVRPGEYLLCQDGVPVARTDPHATWMTRL